MCVLYCFYTVFVLFLYFILVLYCFSNVLYFVYTVFVLFFVREQNGILKMMNSVLKIMNFVTFTKGAEWQAKDRAHFEAIRRRW